MARRRRTLVFALAVFLAAIVVVPLGLLLPSSLLARNGLSASEVVGTPWNGTLRGTRWNGVALGDVSLGVRPLSLLQGLRRVNLSNDRFAISIIDGRRRGFEHARGSITLDRVPVLPDTPLRLHLDDASVVFDDGRCWRAVGNIRVDLTLAAADLPLLPLEGQLTCDGASARAVLASPTEAGVRIAVTVTVDADGGYRIDSTTQGGDASTLAGLRLAGFQDSPSGMSRTDEGVLFVD